MALTGNEAEVVGILHKNCHLLKKDPGKYKLVYLTGCEGADFPPKTARVLEWQRETLSETRGF